MRLLLPAGEPSPLDRSDWAEPWAAFTAAASAPTAAGKPSWRTL